MKNSQQHIQYNRLKYTSLVKLILSSLFLVLSVNVIAQPVISSFSPTSGTIGTYVTINGSGFNTTAASNIVYFGATKATVTMASAASLTVTAPAGASYQPITVLNTADNLTGYSAQPFNTTFNNGSGQTISASSFNTLVNFTTGTNPFTIVAVSDIDGDGKPDLIVTNEYSNTFSVLRNTSTSGSITTASFAAKVDFATDSTPSSITVGDIDGDGKPDIILTSQFKNTISIFRNTSVSGSINSSSFAAKVDFITDTLSLPSSVAIGDIDGDGKPDIVVTNPYSNTISVLQNTSLPGSITSSSFAAPVDFTAGLGPNFVTITDIDGDAKPDIVVANYNAKTVSVLRNISTAGSITTSSFATHMDFTTNIGPYSLATADINNDGKTDLIVANQGSNNISVLVNNSTSGNISFAAKSDFPSGGNSPFSVAVGNLNGDALPDLVVSNVTTNTLSIFQNTYTSGTAASFGTNVNFTTGYFPFTAIASDLDGDGEADIAVPNDGGNTISIFRNLLPNSVVPVTLLNFTGKYQSTGNVLLYWQTTYELNASYFNIQRSIDGVNFATVGKEDATGNSNFVNNYNYTDANVASLGVNKIYYRLQEVDKNGAATYSDIAPISLSEKDNPVSVFPNPAKNSITVSYPETAANAQIQITTIDGKTISAQTVTIGSNQTQLDISYLSSGTYILVFSDTNHKAVTRFIKL